MLRISTSVTNSKRLNFIAHAILITFFSILSSSCSNDDEGDIPPDLSDDDPQETINLLTPEIKDFIYFRGDEKASTVLISIPGGPSTEFDSELVDLIIGNFNTTDILTVSVQQAQTQNPSIVQDNDIMLTQAVSFNTQSIENLYQVINYFKEEGRTVYVLGISFGSFLAQELIARKGIESADKYLIMLGRLDMNNQMWQALAEGKEGYFKNGITPLIDDVPHPEVSERNLLRIAAALARNRYTQEFSSIDDLSNVTYVYGATDMAVGRLTTEEIQFLESKNAQILSGNGGHDEPFVGFFEQGLQEAFGIE